MMLSDTPPKILLIEDDAMLGHIAAEKFRASGFTVVRAEGGKEGIALASREQPDLVLLDVIMPDMNGMDVLKLMKNDEHLRHIPVVLFSNIGQEQEIAEAMRLGAAGYIVKVQYTPEQIVTYVARVLGLSPRDPHETPDVPATTSLSG